MIVDGDNPLNDCVDITEDVFLSLKHIKDNKVVQSPLFDLLEGTRAIEINNPKLDTGLIPLTEEEIHFDCCKPIDEDELCGIMNKVLRLFSSWLDNSSLPLTVLSCRYVQNIVENYTYSLNKEIIHTLQFTGGKYDESTIEYQLTHKVLRSFIIGISKFIGICITIGLNVLYEEEDLITRAMDLNFLSEILSDDILLELNRAIEWCKSLNLRNKALIISHLRLALNLNELPIIFSIPINLFRDINDLNCKNIIQMLNEGAINAKTIQNYNYDDFNIPNGSISKSIQINLDNRNIPGEIYMIDNDKALKQYELIFVQIKNFFEKSSNLKDTEDFNNYLYYDIRTKVDGFNVLTRGTFQLFLIRDDQTIMGLEYSLSSMTIKLMENLNCFNSNILNRTWNLPSDKMEIMEEELNKLLRDIDVGNYQSLIINGNNKCRQRQLMNKNILLWDSLQVNCESFELKLWELFNINDKFTESDELGLPLTSFIYYNKLSLMIEYLLSGFELELYKDYEIYLIYWYSSYLIKILIDHVSSRIILINKYKLNQLRKKKQKNKQLSDFKKQSLMKIINQNELLIEYYSNLNLIIENICQYLLILHKDNIIDVKTLPNKFYLSFEKLFKLRFKSFESVGVPRQLTFNQYLNSIKSQVSIEKLKDNFKLIKNNLTQVSEKITHPGYKSWVDSLTKTCLMFMLELNHHKSDGKLIITKGYNNYFPKISTGAK